MAISRRTSSVLSSGPRFLWNNTVSAIALVGLIVVFLLGLREYRQDDTVHSLRDVHVLVALATVLGLALIVFLAEYLVRRRLLSEARFAQERLRGALVSGKSVAWDFDIANGRNQWFGDLQTMFGIPSEAHSVQLGDFYEFVHSDDRRRVTEAINNARANHVPYASEFRVVRKDGSVRWVNATGTFHYKKNGDPYRMLGVALDITERKAVEQTLRESEERFRLVTNTAPVKIWMSGTDGLRTYFNKRWLDFRGRSIEEELGNGWAEGVHPDDYDRCLTTYDQAFASRIPFAMEYRLRRHDGEYRWILDTGVPRFSPDGSFAGYIGSGLDITERKSAEAALASVGSRLIEAHEEERTWIGRELHDDINQRLALLAVELDRHNKKLPSGVEISNIIEHAQQRIAEITRDVQALSHRLHSSKLDYLGLATAANSFCRELSQQSNVRISFEHSGIARNLPREVSLCLFRVLQEALQNAVKHSGVRQFTAELRGSGGNIELSVTDDGVGFKEEEALTHKGIGLISMRERMQMIDGQLSIESEPGAGTTVRASVRVRAEESQAMAS
jgi:PAS domain S-box-containing protein